MTRKRTKKASPKVGDVVVSGVAAVYCDTFRRLEDRSIFIRREMELITREQQEWWKRLVSCYSLNNKVFSYSFDWVKGEITVEGEREAKG